MWFFPTLALTAGVDTITGTANNDTINGYINIGGTAGTFTAVDTVNGGAGTDSFKITVDGTAAAANQMPGANVTNVENFFIRDVATGGATNQYDFSAVTGEAQVWTDRSTGLVDFQKLGKDTVVGLKGDNQTVIGNVSFDMATATDDVSIAIDGGVGATGTAPTVTNTGTGATKATISSTGAANKVGNVTLANTTTITSLTINAATNLEATIVDKFGTDAAITVSGAATSVKLGTLSGTIKSVDASGLTAGGVSATLSTTTEDYKGGAGVDTVVLNTGIKTATFGAGNDSVTTAAVAATAAGSVKGGEGTDTLVIAATTDVDSAAKRAVYSEFEVLRNKAAGASLDMDGFSGVTAVETEGAIATTFTNMTTAQAAAVKVVGAATTLNIGLKDGTGTADVATVTLGDTKTDSDITTDLVANKFETINIISAGTKVGADATVQKITSDTATKINISGSVKDGTAALFKLNDTSGLSKAVAIDASGITDGSLTLGATSGALIKGSSVIATSLKDTITTAAVTGTTGDFVTYNTGADDDTVNTTAAILNNSSAANASIKVEGGAGTDTLVLTDTGLTIGDAQFQYVTGMEKVSYTVAGQAATITTGGFFNTNFSGGVTVTMGETTTGGAALSLDAQSYTAAATVNALSTGATGASINVKTGSGNDVINVTTGTTFGDTSEGGITIETGLGNDTVDLTNVADAGTVSVTTGAGADIIKGVAVDATITAGTGADSITISTGAQVVVIGNTDSGITVATADTITGFTSGFDTLKMGTAGDATANTGTYVEASAAVADFAAALTAANTALATLAGTSAATELYAFQWDTTNGYLFNDTDGNGTADQVIVLVGITGGSIAATDIVA